MWELPEPLRPMGAYRQFMIYRLEPRTDGSGKMDKKPIDPRTLMIYQAGSDWQNDPAATVDHETAAFLAESLGPGHGVGFLFKPTDPFFFVDIDSCYDPVVGWSETARALCAALPGAAVEVSQSGRGLHIFGSYSGMLPEHSHKNIPLNLEFYTEYRFVALTGDHCSGSAATNLTLQITAVLPTYYPPKTRHSGAEWTIEPVPEWRGPVNNDELIRKALNSRSVGAAFGGRASFEDLWTGNRDAIEKSYGSDQSSADMALAQHLAFWTGKNCERIREIMFKSALVRDKWDREDYLVRTITNAVSLQQDVLGNKPAKLTGSAAQVEWAETIRAEKQAEFPTELFNRQKDATWWIDNKDVLAEELAKRLTPIDSAPAEVFRLSTDPEFVAGYQYLGAQQQAGFFRGCVYVQESHRVFVPSGALLKSEQFNATYGGFVFQLDDSGGKTTKKAFEAFTESQCVRFPKAEAMCFRPTVEPGALIKQDGVTYVNTYVPIETPRRAGDVSPFLKHLRLVLPDERDQTILLSYMAACVQYKGRKFQWAPLIQGAPGNGKSLFSYCMIEAIGRKYSHMPPAKEIDEKFNTWLFNTLFVGVEDIYVPEQRREIIETLKPMITGDWLARRGMQQEQVMKDICCNFIFNSNHKDAIRKTREDRRFCVFYSAQQTEADITRCGMSGSYFPDLYDWLRREGYAVVTEYLHAFRIPEEYNPAGLCHRAPETSTTHEAVAQSLGGVEQEIMEAVEEERPGFCGGWVSSMALDIMLKLKRKDGIISINKRRELLQSLGYDWHPALKNGRVNNPVMPDNGKPRLFIRTGHEALLLRTPAEVARAYEDAQKLRGL